MARTALTREGALLEPFGMMRRLSNEMDRLFGIDRPFGATRSLAAAGETWTPDVEAFIRDGRFVVRADLPGMSEKDVKVELLGNRLTISGERTEEKETTETDYYASERFYGAFSRTVVVPEGADAEKAAATFKQGVLEIEMPMPPAPPPPTARTVEVKPA